MKLKNKTSLGSGSLSKQNTYVHFCFCFAPRRVCISWFQEEAGSEEGRPGAAKTALSSLPAAAWLAGMERLCAALGASMVRRLVTGARRTPQEEANAGWLLHPLLLQAEAGHGRDDLGHSGEAAAAAAAAAAADVVGGGAAPPPCEAEGARSGGDDPPPSGRSEGDGRAGAAVSHFTFVEQLCRHPASRESRALSTAMKRVVLEDRGGHSSTNEVVWAVAVAAVHHAGVAREAAEVVRSELACRAPSATGALKETMNASNEVASNPSPALVRAWRSAQKARVQLGAVPLSSDDHALLLRRAYLLLFLRPWTRTSPGEGGGFSAEIDGRDEAVALALRTSEMVLECLLGQAATGGRGGRRDTGETIAKEDGAGLVNRGGEAREGEIDALLRIIDARSERARSRARGLSLAVRFLDGTGSDRAATGVLLAVTDGLRAGCRGSGPGSDEGTGALRVVGDGGKLDAGRFHFMLGAECCDSASKSALVESTVEFLRQCSAVLGQERAGDRGAAERSPSRRSVVVNALSAVSMDYEWDDNDILERSRLLPLISSLVDDGDRSVAAAASKAMRKFYRCAVPACRVSAIPRERTASGASDAASGAASERFWVGEHDAWLNKQRESGCTPFQRTFFAAVRRRLEDTAAAIRNGPQVAVDPTTTTAAALAGAQGLALAHACCRVGPGRQELSTPGSVRALMRLVLTAESETRGWALRVCAATLPWVEPKMVDEEFRRVAQGRVARSK